MKIHVLGICGTFMGSLALLARELGHQVGGCDANVYPPMSTLLAEQGIAVTDGYDPQAIPEDCDLVVIGNALSRGNAAVEHVLDAGMPYASGAQWLGEHVLPGRRVLAVAGTHGKTTTASMLVWILERAGHEPGYLIGGVPRDLGVSARLGSGECFVVEADEYDTAFFDKRSKFVHYRPRVAILNNLEYDHADIFPDLAAIQTQFHHFVRTIPGQGRLVVNAADGALAATLGRGCWTPLVPFLPPGAAGPVAGDVAWRGELRDAATGAVAVRPPVGSVEAFRWGLSGAHNLANAVAACAAAFQVGVDLATSAAALAEFTGVRRRQERLADRGGVLVYDDFAHHPSAIASTLAGFRAREPERRLVAVLEPRSNSMRMGAHAAALPAALDLADRVLVLARRELDWSPDEALGDLGERLAWEACADALVERLLGEVRGGDLVVFMSNGGFDGVQARFVDAWTRTVADVNGDEAG